MVQLFSNGDILYATTIARQLKFDDPASYVIWMVSDKYASILSGNPFVDELVLISGFSFQNTEYRWQQLTDLVEKTKLEKKADTVVFSQLAGTNLARYDYCIRSGILRSLGRAITVPVQPVLRLSPIELEKVNEFTWRFGLANYRSIILFEYSPKSGQARWTSESAKQLAQWLTREYPNLAIIMSSDESITGENDRIIDGSSLTLRETAALSKYCHLLLGCSSGITWACSSEAGASIPMVQILSPKAYWLNSVKYDHMRFGLSTDHVIEIKDEDLDRVASCLKLILDKNFELAKKEFDETIMPNFRITRGIIVRLLVRGDWKGVWQHISLNLRIHHFHWRLIKSIFLGFISLPFLYSKVRREGSEAKVEA